MMNFVGIDPGKSGGIAIVSHPSLKAEAYKMPETERDILDLLVSIRDYGNCFAVIESVHAFPGQGVSSTFHFGMNYGMLRMALIAAGIPFDTCPPAKWQKALGCLSKGDKNITKAKAQEIFPEMKITHAIADALLIAWYCMKVNSTLITKNNG